MIHSVATIKANIARVLMEEGMSYEDSLLTADVLIEGDLRGYSSHGMNRLFQILEGFQFKTLNPLNKSKVILDNHAIYVVDGNGYLGQPLGHKAIIEAVKRARLYGVGISGVINAGHIGILSYYSEMAARENCVGIVMSTSSPAVSVKGSGEKLFGTNPLSFSIPANFNQPIISDFSTSKVSRGKIYDYLKKGLDLPVGWAVNRDGQPTTHPQEALDGAIQTFDSGYKSANLSLLISVLAGPLIGGVINTEVSGTRFMDEKPNKGDLFICLNVSHFTSIIRFKNYIDHLIQIINHHDCEYRVPGHQAYKKKQENLKKGLFISNELAELFQNYHNKGHEYAA